MCLYSVHDTTLIALFSAFDIKLEKWPPFAAYITLELYENKVCSADFNSSTAYPISLILISHNFINSSR